MTPQLPINGGLTIAPETLLSRVHNASWYICKVSSASIELLLYYLLLERAHSASLVPNSHTRELAVDPPE